MENLIKKIWNGISMTLVVVMVLCAVLLAGARLIGLQVFTVISGSMEPSYHLGSLIYVKEVEPETLKEGDVITFMLNQNTVATHRIIKVLPDEEDPTVLRFRTKGDANLIEDTTPVHEENVLGKVVGTIPYLGYVSDYVQNPPGTYVVFGAVALLILAVFLPDILKPEKKQEEETVAEDTAEANERLKAEIESLKAKMQSTAAEQTEASQQDSEEA